MASTLLLIEFNSSIWFLASSRRPEISAVFDIIVLVVVEVISDEVASAGFVVIVIVWDVVGALVVVVVVNRGLEVVNVGGAVVKRGLDVVSVDGVFVNRKLVAIAVVGLNVGVVVELNVVVVVAGDHDFVGKAEHITFAPAMKYFLNERI